MCFHSLATLGKLASQMIPPILMTVASFAHGQTTGLGSVQLDNYINQQMSQIRTPGLSVLAVRGGDVLWSKGYGYADVEQQIPVTPDTVFHLASISKTVVATAAMQLWENDQFELDDDINAHLPFPVRNPNFPDAPITFRMLLQHTGGLAHGFHAGSQVIEIGADSPIPLGDFLSEYFVPGGEFYDANLNFIASSPGTKFEYSNAGYDLLGYLVERISGMPFDEYTNENIFEPLGMDHTSWRIADLAAANIEPAIPYIYDHTTQSYFPYGHNATAAYPSSGLRSSASDLAKFLLAHMSGGTHDGATILDAETVSLMQMPHSDIPANDAFAASAAYGFGFGLIEREPHQEELSIGHGGLWYGVATRMDFRPEDGVGVIVLANAAPGILTPVDAREIPGHEFSLYSFLPERLLDEAAAADAVEAALNASSLTTSAVPEPATLAMCVISLFTIGVPSVYRRRFRV